MERPRVLTRRRQWEVRPSIRSVRLTVHPQGHRSSGLETPKPTLLGHQLGVAQRQRARWPARPGRVLVAAGAGPASIAAGVTVRRCYAREKAAFAARARPRPASWA